MMSDQIAAVAPQTMDCALEGHRSERPDDGEVLDRLLQYLARSRPLMSDIKDVVCEFYSVHRFEIEGARTDRRHLIVFTRQVFCHLAYKYTRSSYDQIARRVGYTNHTSCIHAVRRIAKFAVTRPLVRDDLDLLRLRIAERMLQRATGRRL